MYDAAPGTLPSAEGRFPHRRNRCVGRRMLLFDARRAIPGAERIGPVLSPLGDPRGAERKGAP